MTNYGPIDADLLLSKKSCCGNRCTNCPYLPRYTIGSTVNIRNVADEYVSILECYGLDEKGISLLEHNKCYKIRDLLKIQDFSNLRNVAAKYAYNISEALSKLMNGEPMTRNFRI